ncbi:MAG: protein kinase [Planctomycetes bacterium]|nr:protein kinase [Planctomycetota bacterium]
MLDPDKNEQALFQAAVRLTNPAEREAYVKQACGDDPALLARLTLLLQAHNAQLVLLDALMPGPDADIGDSAISEGPGTVIGRYKLLEKIGEGGMAVVYMAEQTEPIRRKVALKIIKLGMDTRQVIARFEAERQALALMDHPSIAKVLDAGATETGRPYFVMELVQGLSITEYCDKNSLSTKDRLILFLQVCHAVQHAHQKGIIHRDIKPSNVMVTQHDGKPMPKVIDFGIAKATNQKLTEKTLFTRYAHIIGTPAYMSPEQAELSDLDVDTRSDIYSLGVLLYELLTGTTPFSEEELRKAGYVEMQRVIREQEPIKPSTKLSALGDTLTDIAKRRNCTPDLLRKTIRGDLDWIVMKSLEKDRVRRYETAGGLAEDVRRHLEHEPVVARGPSTTYRLGKFLRRHRVQTIALLATILLIGATVVVLSLWNQDRLRLVKADGFRDQGVLSQAREQYARGQRQAALQTIQSVLQSQHVGPEAQLLCAGILAEDRRVDEAMAMLGNLVHDRPEIAGAAHALLARILWESQSPKAEKSEEIEEHRRQAEALLPETAEAHFLRAITAATIKEQLASLNQALQLDPAHYESLRLRAFTHYASRKYERMKDDALVMTVLRPRDPRGYSLRAIAQQELGHSPEAIADFDSAMARTAKEDPQYIDLAARRCEALLHNGDYEQVTANAQEALKLWPHRPVFQYHKFCALTLLGDYEKAEALFREIVGPGQESRQQFENWRAKYVFDTLAAGRSWHAPNREPAGAAFLPMVEVEETYGDLSAKAKRVVADGFTAHWSPDGKKLAFSMGVQGYSGLAIYDRATRETDLLIVPGKDPAWSPDGQYIAFVRDCQVLRLPEFVTAERKSQHRSTMDEEVWVIQSNGTAPRRLARGYRPCWSRDSACVYYASRADNTLYSIALAGPDTEPKQIMKGSGAGSALSPDNRRVAYVEGAFLRVKELDSQTLAAEWRVPVGDGGWPAWSPRGQELCLGTFNNGPQGNGLWLYNVGRREPAHVLGGPIRAGSWARNGTEFVFHLGPPYFEIWAADLDPNTPIMEALGPAQTSEQYFREMVAIHTRRIKTDPRDAYAYSDRARCYDGLHDQANADADMKRWSAVVSGRSASDSWFGTLGNRRYVINMPFDCELVFSAERPVDATPIVSVAFGQKGRCEMKLFEIPMVVPSLVGLCFLAGLDGLPARADFTFGEPVDLQSTFPFVKPANDFIDCFTADGLEMYITSNRGGGQGGSDLWVCRRASPEDDWGAPENLGPVVNSAKDEIKASITGDGLELYFYSNRPGWRTYVTKRATRDSPWGPATLLGPGVNSSSVITCDPSVTADGLELYFTYWPGGYGQGDFYVSQRATTQDPWGPAADLGPAVNSPANERWLWISPDGLLLFFHCNRPGGYGSYDVWMTKRASRSAPWEPAVNLGPKINGPLDDGMMCLAPDGSALYFGRGSGNTNTSILKAPILPLVDFNGDGKVEAKDLDLLMADWGKSNSVCDIGPFPWGDGAVDEKDLEVLLKSLVTPSPNATDVSCDVVLSWTLPSSTPACDVYLGTSCEAVNAASRANPQGVLASQGQTAATYDPAGLLELSRTYYWRVDFVITGPTPAIYRGPVLKFTTAALTYPIKNITAKASSAQAGSGPERTVDGSGLDKTGGHSTDQKDMWWSQSAAPHWIQYEFDKVYTLHEMWVWNFNMMIEPFMGFGAKTVKIEYSTDGTTWTALANVPEFAKAPGKAGYTANTIVSFASVPAKYVKLTIEKNWSSSAPQTGLSEVRFFAIQSAAVKP